MRHRRKSLAAALCFLSECPDRARAESAHCRKSVPAENSTLAARSGFAHGERYVDIVRCGSVSLLITRLQPNLRIMEWVTIARPWHNGRAGAPARLLPRTWHLAHNAATVCVNDTLHVFGGQYRNYTVSRGATARGVFHASASAMLAPGSKLSWAGKALQFEGWHAGCTERRAKFKPYCEFDGQFSAVYFKERFYLFGRANLHPVTGARHVQVTSAPADLSSWAPFKLVQLPGIDAGRSDSNVYYFNVQVYRGRLLGLFPAVLPATGSSGIYATWSNNGVDWTRPQRLLHAAAFCHRTRVHPSRLVGDKLYVLNNIDVSEPQDIRSGHTHTRGSTRPYLLRMRVDVDEQTMLGLQKLSSALTFRVHNDTWEEVPVDDTGIDNFFDEPALGRSVEVHRPAAVQVTR